MSHNHSLQALMHIAGGVLILAAALIILTAFAATGLSGLYLIGANLIGLGLGLLGLYVMFGGVYLMLKTRAYR